MLFTVLTVIVAGALGGAIAIELTALVVIAAAALALFALLNGLRIMSGVWSDLERE